MLFAGHQNQTREEKRGREGELWGTSVRIIRRKKMIIFKKKPNIR